MATPGGPRRPGRLRWAWWLLAGGSLALGVVGIVVPGLPTVPFILLSAYAAARGSERLHQLLKRVDAAKAELLWCASALKGRATRGIERRRARLGALGGSLNALTPLATLQRGYAVARDGEGRALTSTSAFAPDMPFDLVLRDGVVAARAADVRKSP